jgi:replicative DNA helicase
METSDSSTLEGPLSLDLDDEIIFHLAIPESVDEMRKEQIGTKLIYDKFTRTVYDWQMQHVRDHGKPATALVLEDEFDGSQEDLPALQILRPETAIGDLITRLRERHVRNEGKASAKRISNTVVEAPLEVARVMVSEGKRLGELIARRGERFGSGDFTRALNIYEKDKLAGAGPSLGYAELDEHFYGMKGLTFLVGAPKTYKALALDTPIPTPTGWTLMGDLRVGDSVFDETGNVCRVTAQTEVFTGRPCYRVEFSDGTHVIADKDHEWVTFQKSKRGRSSISTTEEIIQTLRRPDIGSNHSIPVSGAITCSESQFKVSPYVLGAWLGDGTSEDGAITTGDPDILCEIMDHFQIRKWKSAKLTYGVLGLRVRLRELGVLGNKHIPTAYLRGNYSQRLELLQGLMDTDGSCTGKGECVFVTTKPALRDGILELVRSLGFKPVANEYRATLYGEDCGPKWHVRFKAYSDTPVFRLQRKLQNQDDPPNRQTRSQTRQITNVVSVPSTPVKCIEVDSLSHLYLAGEGMIPTHNSWITTNALIQNVLQGRHCWLYSLELPAVEAYWRVMCMAANVPYWKYLKSVLMPAELDHLHAIEGELMEMGTFSTEKPPVGERSVEAMTEKAASGGADVIFIDQLQYCETQAGRSIGSLNNTGDYWEVCDDFRDFSDKVPLWIVHQFNRSVMNNKDGMPEAQQGKGSSAIEETATLELGLWANKELRASNVLQVGTLASRNYDHLEWHLDVNLSNGCSFDMRGVVDDEEDEDD